MRCVLPTLLTTAVAAFSGYLRPIPRRKSATLLRQAWQSHVSTHPEATSALEKILRERTGDDPDIAFLFVSPIHAGKFPDVVKIASEKLGDKCRLLSIVGGGVVGENVEMDEPTKPGMALMTGVLPQGTDMELFSFNELKSPPPPVNDDYWKNLVDDESSVILFVDPWSPLDTIMESLSQSSVVTGGISVPTGTGPTIAIDGEAMPQGSCVGLRFKGNMGVQAMVAQGCQPVGPSFTITACEGNIITELDSRPALKTLEDVANTASPVEQKKISSGLVCGIAGVDQEDYLIRQIMGFVPAKQGLAIGSKVEAGDRFRFHVRDREAAEGDLELMIKRAKTERLFDSSRNHGNAVAALQISCVARGRSLFGQPGVDLAQIKELLDEPVVGGFYANGEIGPVGIAGFSSTSNAGTYLHGFTTVAAILCDYSAATTLDETGPPVNEPVDAWG